MPWRNPSPPPCAQTSSVLPESCVVAPTNVERVAQALQSCPPCLTAVQDAAALASLPALQPHLVQAGVPTLLAAHVPAAAPSLLLHLLDALAAFPPAALAACEPLVLHAVLDVLAVSVVPDVLSAACRLAALLPRASASLAAATPLVHRVAGFLAHASLASPAALLLCCLPALSSPAVCAALTLLLHSQPNLLLSSPGAHVVEHVLCNASPCRECADLAAAVLFAALAVAEASGDAAIHQLALADTLTALAAASCITAESVDAVLSSPALVYLALSIAAAHPGYHAFVLCCNAVGTESRPPPAAGIRTVAEDVINGAAASDDARVQRIQHDIVTTLSTWMATAEDGGDDDDGCSGATEQQLSSSFTSDVVKSSRKCMKSM